jgi:hypothetical protein
MGWQALTLLAYLTFTSLNLVNLDPGSTPDQMQARLALMALRATVPVLESDMPYVLGTESESLSSSDEILARLALAPKPMTCAARVSSGAIRFDCHSMEDLAELERHFEAERKGMLALRRFLSTVADNVDDASPLVVRSGGTEILIPLGLFEAWELNYRIEGSLVVVDPPDGPAAALGAVALVRFDRASKLTWSLEEGREAPNERDP